MPRQSRPAPVDLPSLCAWLAEESMVFADSDSPFGAHVTAGVANLVLIVGENASGKSLFFRALAGKVATTGALPVTISIRERAGAGTGSMSRLRQSFIFGDETEQSTGATSVRAVVAGFSNLDREQGSVLGLDEPELGLSAGYARALGEYIGTQTLSVPAGCAGVVVVTHSRDLVAGLLTGLRAEPTFVRVYADAPVEDRGLHHWLTHTETRTVAELLELQDTGLERFRRTHALLKG